MYASVLFWVGAWSVLDVDLNGVRFEYGQHVRDASIGLVLLVVTDAYYGMGHVRGSLWPKMLTPACSVDNAEASTLHVAACECATHVRVGLALVGSVMLWNGLYNLLYWSPHEDQLAAALGFSSVVAARGVKCALALVFGLLLLATSGTLLEVSRVPVDLLEAETDSPAWGSPLSKHGRAFARTSASLCGQVMLWFGVYELCLTWCPVATLDDYGRCMPLPYQNPWKPLFFASLGMVVFLATGTFVPSAFLDSLDDEPLRRTRSPRATRKTAVLYARCTLAILGSAVHNTGLWVLIDDALFNGIWHNCSWRGEAEPEELSCGIRHVLFISIGYCTLLVVRAAAGNVGIEMNLTPTSSLRPQLTPPDSFRANGLEFTPAPVEADCHSTVSELVQ
mmetsp:Transcript_58628/g.134511  ORF Transcript_58628/g.134511 Transcript_58628/m.134511 type:complete len:393 (-) Transcript_58628:158-1336(-)